MPEKLDYKKQYKDLYMPKEKPSLVDVPSMLFIAVDGRGDPNTSSAYEEALELLYGLTFTIKMSKMSNARPEGYFEYVVPPLEGLWWFEDGDFDGLRITNKDAFFWTSMIRQPEFVTPEFFEWARASLQKKKPELETSKARFIEFREGLCAQLLHIGPYDDEPASIQKLDAFITESGHRPDFSEERKHHEIYLGDPRKTAPEKLRTVIRHPVALK